MDLNNVDGIQILDQEVNWHRRGITEAIHIRIMGSKINKEKGATTFPLSTTTFFSPVTQQPSRLLDNKSFNQCHRTNVQVLTTHQSVEKGLRI